MLKLLYVNFTYAHANLINNKKPRTFQSLPLWFVSLEVKLINNKILKKSPHMNFSIQHKDESFRKTLLRYMLRGEKMRSYGCEQGINGSQATATVEELA